MTNEERHIAVLNRMLESMDVYDSIQPTTERKKAIKAAIKALEQQPCRYWQNGKCNGNTEVCEDAISRKAVFNAIEQEDKWLLSAKGHNGLTEIAFSGLKARVDALPSVTPQQNGHWEHGKEISREYRGQTLVNINYLDWHCSNCHCVVEQSIKPEWSYCPNCGAKMQESEE